MYDVFQWLDQWGYAHGGVVVVVTVKLVVYTLNNNYDWSNNYCESCLLVAAKASKAAEHESQT
jgi:hypothetical protein